MSTFGYNTMVLGIARQAIPILLGLVYYHQTAGGDT